MIVPRYGPGSWQAVVTDGHVCLLPPHVDVDTVAALWTAVREGAGLTAQLQLLLAGGLDALPPFALVALERDRVHVVVRGDVEVQVHGDEPRTVRGRRVATWQEEVVDGAHAVVARVLDGGTGAEARLPVLSAVVHADVVTVDLRSGTARSAPASEAVAVPSGVARPEPVVEPSPSSVARPEPEHVLEPEPESVARPSWAPVTARPQPGAAPAPHGPQEPSPGRSPEPDEPVASPLVPVAATAAPSTGLDDLEHTVLHAATDTAVGLPLGDLAGPPAPVAPTAPVAAQPAAAAPVPAAPVPAAPASPAPVPAAPEVPRPAAAADDADHDGTTVLSSDVVALRRQLPEWAGDGFPGPLAVPAADRPAPAKIRLSSGLVVSLTRPVLLGRAPQVSRVSNREMPRLVTVASPRQDISRTHAEVRMDGDDVLVTDLRSTNGVLLLRQGQGPQRLHPGEPTVVEPGVSVDLGEGVTFVVERGA